MSDFDVEALKNFCNSLGESLGVGQHNYATLVGVVYLLLSIRLVAIVNEIGRVVINVRASTTRLVSRNASSLVEYSFKVRFNISTYCKPSGRC